VVAWVILAKKWLSFVCQKLYGLSLVPQYPAHLTVSSPKHTVSLSLRQAPENLQPRHLICSNGNTMLMKRPKMPANFLNKLIAKCRIPSFCANIRSSILLCFYLMPTVCFGWKSQFQNISVKSSMNMKPLKKPI